MNNLIVIGLAILLMASASDVAIHLIGLGWFAGSLSAYTVVVDLVIVSGVIAGAVSLFFPKVPWINKLVIAILGGALVAIVALPLMPNEVEIPWFSATLICIYLARSIMIIHLRSTDSASNASPKQR
jgi:hypothetical protein